MALKKKVGYLSVIPAALLFTACGGGGDTSTTTSTTPTSANLVGTVPGTLIQAFCSDGSNPSVNSIQDGSDEHPFSLALPYNTDCRIVMITNEGTENQIITPLTFNGNSVLNLQTELDLKYVPLAMDPALIVDANGDGVVDEPLDVSIEETTGVSVFNLSVDPMDTDLDGIPNVYDDDDNDGIINSEDDDYQHDGDADADGIADEYDRDDDNDGTNETTTTVVTTPVTSFNATSGRLLASQCFQCHGTNGRSVNGWDSIAGESYGEILEELAEYPTTHIMGAQSVGYTLAERQALASYLSSTTVYSSSTTYSYESDDDDDDDHDERDDD